MAITQIPFPVSSELEKELSVFAETQDGEKIFQSFRSSSDLIRHVRESSEYMDITRVPTLVPKGKVLDVGVAYGLTSGYLALNGFDVTCVEPSLRLCNDMEQNFRRLGIAARIVNATGEVLNKLEGGYDLVVFYSSLHHCDDVDATLRNAHQLLKPGGKIFLYEPVLKFYRTKEWFFRQMEEHPENVGHYGGNEHIYRYGEYVRFLKKAGFIGIRSLPSITYQQRPKQAPWDSSLRFGIKKLYFWSVRTFLLSMPPLLVPLKQLSLINPVILAEK